MRLLIKLSGAEESISMEISFSVIFAHELLGKVVQLVQLAQVFLVTSVVVTGETEDIDKGIISGSA